MVAVTLAISRAGAARSEIRQTIPDSRKVIFNEFQAVGDSQKD